MLQCIAENGSFAAAARARDMVPSALTYRVRQIEDALDVLLFDRSARQARLTAAGSELIREGQRLLTEIDAVAHRVRRVASGWEAQFTIAVDSIINPATVLDLCEEFFALAPPTRLRIRAETLSGTLDALTCGLADLSLGVVTEIGAPSGLQLKPLGSPHFVFAVAPHHPFTGRAPEPLSDQDIGAHRIVAAADSIQRGSGMSVGLISGQDVFTREQPAEQTRSATTRHRLRVSARMAGAALHRTRTTDRQTSGTRRASVHASYAWRKMHQTPSASRGRALQWWLDKLESPHTRQALMYMCQSNGHG